MHNESRADLITEANPDQLVRVPTLKEKVVNTALVGAIFVAPVALGVGERAVDVEDQGAQHDAILAPRSAT